VAEHGGYRKPANPAPVSGPGAHSKRTDGGQAQSLSAAPDQPYGDATQQLNDQRIAPMAGTPEMPPPPNVPATPPTGPEGTPYAGGPFGAPSTRPHEPVTTGVPIGPGAGPATFTPPGQQPSGAMTQMLQGLSATDTTGVLASLYQAAISRGV